MWPGLSSDELIKRAQRARSRSNPLALIEPKMRRGERVVPRCDDEIQLPADPLSLSLTLLLYLSLCAYVCLCASVCVCVFVDVLNSQQD